MSKYEVVTYKVGERQLGEVDNVITGKDILAEVFFLNGEEKIFAGKVVEFTQFHKHKRLEAYSDESWYGSITGSGIETIEEGIDKIKRYYDHKLENEERIHKLYVEWKEICDKLDVSEELYKRYANVRTHVQQVEALKNSHKDMNSEYNELALFRDSSQFDAIPSPARSLVYDRLQELKKGLELADKEMVKLKQWLKEYEK